MNITRSLSLSRYLLLSVFVRYLRKCILIKTFFYSCLLGAAPVMLFAQTPPPYKADVPVLIPASAEATNFVKAGVGNSNMSTGAATANIPLYTIKLRDFELPISLSYSTQGLKVDERSSRAGYQWILNANGMITRSVRSVPDEFGVREPVPSDLLTDSDSLFFFYDMTSNPESGQDTQPDEFQFSFNGYSGKFVLDDNHEARVTSTSNLDIDVHMVASTSSGSTSGHLDSVTIRTPDGVMYSFGKYYEITQNVQGITFPSSYKNITRTAFFLHRIVLPQGDHITFNYEPVSFDLVTGKTQTLQLAVDEEGFCEPCKNQMASYTTTDDKITYNSRYLSSIVASNGLTVNLSYSGQDGSMQLSGLDVVGIKKYQFEYTSAGQRHFLTTISDVTAGINNSLDHVLTYEQLSSVPAPLSFEQDYLGFYNGSGRTYFIPTTVSSAGTINFDFRKPNGAFSKIGTLKSILYPTGGKEEFIYEPNTQSTVVYTENIDSYAMSTESNSPPVTNTRTINVPFDQMVTVRAYTEIKLANPTQQDYDNVAPGEKTFVEIWDGSTKLKSKAVLGLGSMNYTIDLQGSHTYTLKVTVVNPIVIAHAAVDFLLSPPTYDTVNVEIPGLRLKELRYTDPFLNSGYSRYFTYEALSHPGKSTGSAMGSNSFYSTRKFTKFCSVGGVSASEAFGTCTFDVYSTSTAQQVYNYSGSGSMIYYTHVIESDAPTFAHGGTEYVFFPNDTGTSAETVKGAGISYVSGGQYPTTSGMVQKKTVFDTNRSILSQEVNVYEELTDMTNAVTSVIVRKNFDPPFWWQARLDAFDVMRGYYSNTWIRIKSQTVTGTTVVPQKTEYAYNTWDNVQPWKITTRDSKKSIIETEMFYPNTFTTSNDTDLALPGYAELTGKNMVAPVVFQTLKKNGVIQQQKKVIYKDWFSNNKVVVPQRVMIKSSPGDELHDELIYNSYDFSGNPLSLQKAHGEPTLYLWDKKYNVPICAVQNASMAHVSYTGFENETYGTWQILSGATDATYAFTGEKSFTGTIQRTFEVNYGDTLQVTLWTRASATVNSISGTLIKEKDDGWKLYRWKIHGSVPQITVSGTQFDEVRLSPLNATMQTFVHYPFVGVRTVIDANNKTTHYEYDALWRLIRVKDDDGNLLKTMEYHYDQQ